jgi:hypothetical protein
MVPIAHWFPVVGVYVQEAASLPLVELLYATIKSALADVLILLASAVNPLGIVAVALLPKSPNTVIRNSLSAVDV